MSGIVGGVTPQESRGEPVLSQCPRRKVGGSVYISVPGRVPVIKARRAAKAGGQP